MSSDTHAVSPLPDRSGLKQPYHLVDPSPWPIIGALAGGLAGGLNGARIGAGAGAAAGIAWALLKRGSDVRLDVGTSVEMEIQRAITVDASRIQVARAAR